MTTALPQELRLAELLADRAVQGLSDAEAEELLELQRRFPSLAWQAEGYSAYDLAAAAGDLAMTGTAVQSLPKPVYDRLRATGQQWVAQRAARSGASVTGAPSVGPTRRIPAWAGWVAAAACLALAAAAWWGRLAGPADPATLAAREEQRVSAAPDAVRVSCAAWSDESAAAVYPGVTGEVVWSDAQQGGVMTLSGLPKNLPATEQMQLWIIDATRGMDQRISAAVFPQASPDGRVTVLIRPTIPVRRAAGFAVTLEQPGGTWVSDLKRRVVFGLVQKS